MGKSSVNSDTPTPVTSGNTPASSTPNGDNAVAVSNTPSISELQAQLQALSANLQAEQEEKARVIRESIERKNKLRELNEKQGNFETLYTEAQAELQRLQAELATYQTRANELDDRTKQTDEVIRNANKARIERLAPQHRTAMEQLAGQLTPQAMMDFLAQNEATYTAPQPPPLNSGVAGGGATTSSTAQSLAELVQRSIGLKIDPQKLDERLKK